MVCNEIPKAYKKKAFLDRDLKEMAEDKQHSARNHMKHKPYECDFGGGKNDKKNEL